LPPLVANQIVLTGHQDVGTRIGPHEFGREVG
jgi:hypothetical protein